MKKTWLLFLIFISVLLSGCSSNKSNVYFHVFFDSSGGTGVDKQSVKKDCLVVEPLAPTREGYTFDSWYLDDKEWNFFEDTVTSDIMLTAKWKYQVIYEVDDNSNAIITGHTGFEEKVIIFDEYDGHKVTSIGDGAFAYYKNLVSITIPDGVTSIGNEAFINCSNLTSIMIPNSVISIGARAFYQCWNLAKVAMGNNITDIGNYAFYLCSSLTNLTISNSVTNIGDGAFSSCGKLEYNMFDNGQYLGNDTNPYLVLVKASSKDIENCIINDNTVFIFDYAFSNCKSIESIIIPKMVKKIGNHAFDKCTNLANITLNNDLEYIGFAAFAKCNNLTSIIIPKDIIYIDSNAFSHCQNLTYVYYAGNASQYLSLSNTPDNVSVYYYSETKPTEDGNYWHYIDNVPATWK